MQVASIELDLHKALAASGAISADNAMDPKKSSFMRCARTDKGVGLPYVGVHAGGQVVSLKLIPSADLIENLNRYLPPQIRVWKCCLVKNSFDAKVLYSSDPGLV